MANHKHQVDFIKKWEGGLSNDQRDIGPASHPAPCIYMGQTGWHTNRGITYSTFESNASRLGYAATCENFIRMPDSIWLKIYKVSFWDKFLLDSYRSQSIADIIVSLAWGSGIGGAYKQTAKFLNANYGTNLPTTTSSYSIENAAKIRDVFKHITRTAIGEKQVQEKFISHYRQFYISLNNPTYIKGWLRRVNSLDEFTYSSLRSQNQIRKLAIVGIAATAIAAVSLVSYFLIEEKKQSRHAA